jgi:hypothetical protein
MSPLTNLEIEHALRTLYATLRIIPSDIVSNNKIVNLVLVLL